MYTIKVDEGDGKLTFELPDDVQEELNSLSETDRRSYLIELQVTMTQVARTISTLAVCRPIFLGQQDSFHEKLKRARLACAKGKFTKRTYSLEV